MELNTTATRTKVTLEENKLTITKGATSTSADLTNWSMFSMGLVATVMSAVLGIRDIGRWVWSKVKGLRS